MEQQERFFYMPFIALLAYTFGAFFLNSIPIGGVYLSPGGATLTAGSTVAISTSLLAIVVLVLFFSVRKKRKEV